MIDIEKVIKGLERCLVCDTSIICSKNGQQAYIDCEYTVGLYCGRDKLICDALELLKEQQGKITLMKAVYGDQCEIVGELVRCKDCKYNDDGECIIKAGWFPVKPDWFCADGVKKDG